MSTQTNNSQPIRRLTRLEQLTLNTWRWAEATVHNTLDPSAVLEFAALHAVLGALRDVDDAVALFARHGQAQPEFQLVLSILPDAYRPGCPTTSWIPRSCCAGRNWSRPALHRWN